jgi:nucleoside-triphosphatase THEP1
MTMPVDQAAAETNAVAAVVYGPGSRIEEFFAQLAARLKQRGIAVAGLLQHSLRSCIDDRCAFEMEDLWSGRRYSISQDLGAGSDACSIDHAAIAAASAVLRRAIEAQPDVVLVNKFGALEAAGEGLRAEMTQIVAAGLTLLTTVNRDQIPAWREYAGGEGTELPMDADAVVAWVDAQKRTRSNQIA